MLEANNARSLAISKNFGGMRLSGRKIGFLEHSGLTYRGPGVCGQLRGQLGRLGSLWGLWLAKTVQRWQSHVTDTLADNLSDRFQERASELRRAEMRREMD